MSRRIGKADAATSRTTSRTVAIERYLLQVIITGCVIFGVFGIWASIATAVSTLTSAEVQVREIYAPTERPDLVDASPAIASATSPEATMTVTGLPDGVRWLLVAAESLPAVAGIALAVVLAMTTIGILKRRPFQRSIALGLGLYAVLYLLGEWGHSLLIGIAHSEVADYLARTGGMSPGDPAIGYQFEFSMAPLAWAIALAVIVAAFELGQRMQRDTEGLV